MSTRSSDVLNMLNLRANTAQFSIRVTGIEGETKLTRLEGVEEVSQLFEFIVEIALTDDEITFTDILGKSAQITIRAQDGSDSRNIDGIVRAIQQIGIKQSIFLYRLILVPSVWTLTQKMNCRIFQDKGADEIIDTILQEAGLPSDRYQFNVNRVPVCRKYCVQYNETDWDFIQRLLNEEGIFYYFSHAEDGHTLKMCSESSSCADIPEPDIEFDISESLIGDHVAVHRFSYREAMRPTSYTSRDYLFTNPSLDLTANHDASVNHLPAMEQYSYPGLYDNPDLGAAITERRQKENQTFEKLGDGDSNCPRLYSGHIFNLENHPTDSFNQRYFVFRVKHQGVETQALQELASSERNYYKNTFECIPVETSYIPQRRIPKPRIQGAQTAIVVGPSEEEIHTDEYGRVRVKFHWDREQSSETSSCWIRVAQMWSGTSWGAMFIPRVGQEVVVEFLEGDPDRPLITGCVYHSVNTPAYRLPQEKTKSVIRTNTSPDGGSFNELLFEDKKDNTQVVLSNAYGHQIIEDEATRCLTIKTRDENQMIMDDENEIVTVKTKNQHKLEMDDANQKFVLTSKDGHAVLLDDANTKIEFTSKEGHKFSFDDGNQRIEITSVNGHNFIIDDGYNIVSVKSSEGHALNIDEGGGTLELTNSEENARIKIELSSGAVFVESDSNSIELNAPGGDIKLNALNIELTADMDLKAKGLNAKMEGTMGVEVKGGVTAKLEASGQTDVKGGMVMIN
ncbi:MAG: type VI secretion system tip protein VgrG [Gammaproteobacteria bacterium]|nr:type VI secretion system tip protein VgrG [Gammaproteobacteria bacterium]